MKNPVDDIKGDSMDVYFDPGSGYDRTTYILIKPPDGKVWLGNGEYVEWDIYIKAINDYLKKSCNPAKITIIDSTGIL